MSGSWATRARLAAGIVAVTVVLAVVVGAAVTGWALAGARGLTVAAAGPAGAAARLAVAGRHVVVDRCRSWLAKGES
ncbi:MAG TPA: hypothetical protein VFW63_11735 [Acidimicrobiales bacterium]|nr:hypothetical protein [Acidimicrobiales bacterium]